jgi:serine/threonine protein kinase
VTHRDLKHDNILVGDFGETLVIDWGLAKVRSTFDDLTEESGGLPISGSSSLTRVGSVVGTPAYMPPEQAAGRSVDTRADVYALGAVLYHTLAGRRPYQGAPDALAAVIAGPPDRLADLVHGAPPDLVTVVAKAMARDAADRYPNAQALAAELGRFQAGRFVSAHHYTPIERVNLLVRRYPVTSALTVALVAGSIIAVLALVQAYRLADIRRFEAELARAQAETLRENERQRLDEVTLAQARLVLDRDPGAAFRL